jgi:hypothetical protein
VLRDKEPLPFAFQIATPDACQLHQQISDFRRRVNPIEYYPDPPPPPLEIRLSIHWQPGFGLVPR